MSSRALWGVLVLVSVALGVAGPAVNPASGDVVPGQPDETTQQAYPIAPGHTYSGAFDDTSYEDVDYLAFTVTSANQTSSSRWPTPPRPATTPTTRAARCTRR